jgi:protein tyrosine phosphatase domain-containing protein 1
MDFVAVLLLTPSVLSTLLYEWLEHLRNPILDTDSITYIVILADNTEKAFRRLPVSVAYTLEYTIRFVTRLQPLHRDKVRSNLQSAVL